MTDQDILDKVASGKTAGKCMRRAMRDAKLDLEGWRRVAKRRLELQRSIASLLRKLAAPCLYASEETFSRLKYPAGHRYQPIRQQVVMLGNYLGEKYDLSYDESYEKSYRRIPGFRLLALPRWQAVAPTYGLALKFAWTALYHQLRSAGVELVIQDGFDWDAIRRQERTGNALARLAEAQGGRDIIMIPANLGRPLRGKSCNRALELMGEQEFGLGTYEAIMFLLTHPHRFFSQKDLWLDCPGDITGNGEACPRFYSVATGKIRLGAFPKCQHAEQSGPATGLCWVPE